MKALAGPAREVAPDRVEGGVVIAFFDQDPEDRKFTLLRFVDEVQLHWVAASVDRVLARGVEMVLDEIEGGAAFEDRAAVVERWLPALETFRPEMIFVSAGFDAHVDDDMSNVNLTDADFRWVTERIVDVAAKSASGRIVSALEGGYELASLARCVEQHVRILMGLH